MAEPLVVAAVVQAAGNLVAVVLKSVLDKAGRSPSAKEAAKKVIAKTYDTLAPAVSTNSLLILRILKSKGSKQSEGMIYGAVSPIADKLIRGGEPFESDVTYRMRFLRTLGLVTEETSEWVLTALGAEFLRTAADDPSRYRDAFALT